MPVPWTDFLTALGTALLGALATMVIVHLVARLASRRWGSASRLAHETRVPFRLLVLLVAVDSVVTGMRPEDVDPSWWGALDHALQIATIGAGAWLLGSVLLFLEDLGLSRYRTDVADNLAARRVQTQVQVLRRLTVAAVVVVALGAALLTFPGVRAVGASLLASAGLVSVVAALAAQSTLANLFAGVQLAFSDAIRIDDIVIVEGEWGRIEEITLSYVVVHLWDDRRLVLPSTYFTQTPFQNWTRHSSELLGAVELDVDWRVDVAAMRDELDRLLEGTDLWDGRSKVLQVTDAVGGLVRVRVLVTAEDAGRLFDLRCYVRERLVAWVQQSQEAGLPRQRVELVERSAARRTTGPEADRAGAFSGDEHSEERGRQFRREETAGG